MSIQGGIGAACAVAELMTLIKTERAKNTPAEEILEKVIKKAKEIKEAGETGWY